MDKHNVEWVLSNGEHGYPAGDFFSAALDIALTSQMPWERFCSLETMVAHADSKHKAQLRSGLPGVVEMIEKTFMGGPGGLTRQQAFDSMTERMIALPSLLPVVLPELSQAIREYAQIRIDGEELR